MEYTYKQLYREYNLKLADPTAEVINRPDKIVEIAQTGFTPIQEIMTLYVLNTKNAIVEEFEVARGNYNTLSITPREIFIHVLRSGCSRFIISHNHPSGNPDPSDEDIQFTRKVKQGAEILGLQILDHIIVTADNSYSFKQGRLL